MRHNVYGKKLSRNKNKRTALFKSLVQSLFTYGTIETSESKAKAVKGLVDKIINLAKTKSPQRFLQAYFSNKLLQERLIKEIAPKLDDRISGYTTMLRIGTREGDRTTLVRMSLIHNEKLKLLEKEEVSKMGKVSKVKPVISKQKADIKKVARKTARTKK